jgi:hypothetical protein
VRLVKNVQRTLDQHRTAECDLFYKIRFKPFAQAERAFTETSCKQTVQIKAIDENAADD